MIIEINNDVANPEGVAWIGCESCHPFGIWIHARDFYNRYIPSGLILCKEKI